MPEQSQRKNLDIVDQELLLNRDNKKTFKAAAYAMGLGVGLILLTPILPAIDDEARQSIMEDVFMRLGYVLILYSLSLAFGFFLLRPHIALIRFVLNWVVIPAAGVWAVVQIYKAMNA